MSASAGLSVGSSPLHVLDARVKLIAAAAFSVGTAVLTSAPVAVFALAAAAVLLIAARPPMRAVARRLLVANAFIGAMWLFLPWSVPGEAVAAVGPVELTDAGLARSVLITLKCNAILAAVIALLATSTTGDLAHALRSLRVPRKLVMMFFFCVRYVGRIGGEYRRLADAARMRAFRPRPDRRTYRAFAELAGTLLVRTSDRAGRVYQAMLCRGFRGSFPELHRAPPRRMDLAAGAAIVAFAVLLVLLEWLTMAR